MNNETKKLLFNNLKLLNETCIYNNNNVYLFGQFNKLKINTIDCYDEKNNSIDTSITYCNVRRKPYFYIKFVNINDIKDYVNKEISINVNNYYNFKIILKFPFLNDIFNTINKNSNIILTMCKNYNNRLDEWIKYNLKLGYDNIIIFNNDSNKKNRLNESIINKCNDIDGNIRLVTDKYKDKVIVIDFPYTPLHKIHYDTIQHSAYHIGTTVLKDKCKTITYIDADEFIYIPNNNNIKKFLLNYNNTLTIQSNIITNYNNEDIIDNNILSLSRYVGQDKYTKIILFTHELLYNHNGNDEIFFVCTPHDFKNSKIMDKSIIIHYHAWVNKRCEYNKEMCKIDILYDFYNK